MRRVDVCGCSRGCAKPHKSQQCGLSLHRRKFFLARFEHFPSTASAFSTEEQRPEILMMASAEAFLGGIPKEGFTAPQPTAMGALGRAQFCPALELIRSSAEAPGVLPTIAPSRALVPPSTAGRAQLCCAGGALVDIFLRVPRGFFPSHRQSGAERSCLLARLPRLQPLAPLFQRHIVQM